MKKNKVITLFAFLLTMMIVALSSCSKQQSPPEPTASPTETTPNLTQPTPTPPEQPTTEIIILHTNDTHGRIVGNDSDIIGIDHVAAIRKNTPNSILLDAGDTLHGLPIATLSRGADIAALMKAAGYNAMTVGNHEFNYGWERLAELRELAGFPFLASNVTKEDGAPYLDDTTIIEVDGVKIGLFGVTTEATAHSAMPEYVAGLAFADPVAAARDSAALLQSQGVHIIVAICHLGSEPYNGTLSAQLAHEVPEIDVIIDGHSHTGGAWSENGVLIVQAGDYGSSLGKVAIAVENGQIVSKTAALIDFGEARITAPDEAVAALLNDITENLNIVLSEAVGESSTEMSSERAPGVRTQEMPLGNLVADAYREAAGADIAIANGGDIRADLMSGVVTKGDIISILPFGNTLMLKTVTPALLREILENGVSGIVADENGEIDHEQSPQGRFLQVSGFSFSYEPAAPEGERVRSITLDDGSSLSLDDNTTTLTIAGSNYVMTGGDFYTMLGELPVERELGTADEALAAYVARYSPVADLGVGRIVVGVGAGLE
ncbi:MAG: 5'-nucleotidase C-terminal domain-containing protein [Defluviitaleaceae bacterium]|nr:5'-nucleotidase C-terminal domain-containing protein [Defluviitaleaceae bacterium]